jgi:sugar lactone lactonase YvrE
MSLRRRDCLCGLGASAAGSFLLGCKHATPSTMTSSPPGPGPAAPLEPGPARLVAGGVASDSGPLATQTRLIEPFGVARDTAGNLFVVEANGHRVRRIDRAGGITTYAGRGEQGKGGDGGPATEAQFDTPHHLAFSPGSDDLFITDTRNHRIRRIDPKTGVITTVIGTGEKGFAGDGGKADKAVFNGIYCMAFNHAGDRIYLADLGNRRIRVVDRSTGLVETVAGNGEKGVPPDGAEARGAPLVDPRAVAVDSKGNIYILERNGHALRMVDPSGKIRTVAGTGQQGAGGNGGDALAATFNGPKYLTVDPLDDVLIVDTENHVIRKYLSRERKVVHVVGTGRKADGGIGGPSDRLDLNRPHGVFVEPASATTALLIADSDNHRVVAASWGRLVIQN